MATTIATASLIAIGTGIGTGITMAFQIARTGVRMTLPATRHGQAFPATHQETLMNIQSTQQTSVSDQLAWKTAEYHGHQMHVWAEPCAVENQALSGHGQQWAFTVNITGKDAGPMAEPSANARSDPGLFYSTQAVAEDMGFLRGRELIEGTPGPAAATPLR